MAEAIGTTGDITRTGTTIVNVTEIVTTGIAADLPTLRQFNGKTLFP